MRAILAAITIAQLALPNTVSLPAKSAISDGRAAALQIAIVDSGKLVSSQAFGKAPSDAAFSIGSVTKIFTAVSIMQLAERGKLGLDDRAATYLPQYPVLRNVTIRQLLSHTSGIPNYADDAVNSGDVLTRTTPGSILATTLARPLDFTPGTDWNYSNTGYVVLGQIVEQVAGLPLGQYERRFIFEPAGMQNTFAAPEKGRTVAPPFGGTPGDFSWYYACGDIFSTAADLARFDIALMQGRIVSRKAFLEMQATLPFTTFAPQMRDGLGLFATRNGELTEIGHHGGEPGYRADDEMVLERQFAVIVLGNGNYDTQPIVNAALRAYFPYARIGAPPAASAYVDGAPTVTRRIRALLQALQSGTVDHRQFHVLAAVAISPAANLLKPYGPLHDLRFLNKIYTSSNVTYEYEARFERGAVFAAIGIAPDGDFDVLQILPER